MSKTWADNFLLPIRLCYKILRSSSFCDTACAQEAVPLDFCRRPLASRIPVHAGHCNSSIAMYACYKFEGELTDWKILIQGIRDREKTRPNQLSKKPTSRVQHPHYIGSILRQGIAGATKKPGMLFPPFLPSAAQNSTPDYLETGRMLKDDNIWKKNTDEELQHLLEEYKDEEGHIDAEKLIQDWFPATPADVFISYSSKNEVSALTLAGFLHTEFKLRPFVDSIAWGHCDELLKLMDDESCFQEEKGTYNYKLRNRTTSHVHLMLSTQLTRMIDQCECLIFLNTPESVIGKDLKMVNEGRKELKDVTPSPWIYHELSMIKLLPRWRYRNGSLEIEKEGEMEKRAVELEVHHKVDLSELLPFNISHLTEWKRKYKGLTGITDQTLKKEAAFNIFSQIVRNAKAT